MDAVFSVSFVFVLAGTIYPGKASYNRDINLTLDLLDHLSLHGNRAACNRRADILQMCDHLGIPREQGAVPLRPGQHAQSDIGNPMPREHLTAFPSQTERTTDNTTPIYFSEPALQWVNDIDELLLQQDPHDFYSLYCNDGFPLAGTVETDWEALERQIFR